MEFFNLKDIEFASIVYGALGSALFALIVYVVPKIISSASQFISKYSVKARDRRLKTLWLKYAGLVHLDKEEDLNAAANQVALIYKSLRELLKAFIWIVLGLIFQSVLGYLGIIGFLGGLYYLFLALAEVQKIDDSIEPYKALREIEEQMDEIELNKSRQQDASDAGASA